MAALSSPARTRRAELARQRRRNLATFVAIAALLTPLAIGSLWVLSNVEQSAANDPDVVVELFADWTTVEIGDALQSAGVITSSADFQTVAASSGLASFPAGRYVFPADIDAREALDTLRGGPYRDVPDAELLLPPGLTLAAIAERVGEIPGKRADLFLQVAQSGTVRSRYQPDDVGSLEGLTWPDTYRIGANETETQILQKIVDEFDHQADERGLGGADATGVSPYQAMIIASMIQTESGNDADSPKISAVMHNRLRQGMLLQIDATLCYAKGGCPPVPVDADRRIDSPYNTYKVQGLPPTPIATASGAAMDAALHPSGDDYLFYVSDKNGVTTFASTQAEHDRNVQRARNAE